jgi:hypothetical protein
MCIQSKNSIQPNCSSSILHHTTLYTMTSLGRSVLSLVARRALPLNAVAGPSRYMASSFATSSRVQLDSPSPSQMLHQLKLSTMPSTPALFGNHLLPSRFHYLLPLLPDNHFLKQSTEFQDLLHQVDHYLQSILPMNHSSPSQ